MKTVPQILVTISALLSVASVTADFGSRAAAASTSLETQVQSHNNGPSRRKLDDDEPWDVGTKVFNDFPNEGWWSGTITSYSAATGMYTVTWEDGSTDYYDDGDKIDEMVAYAQNDPQNSPASGATTKSGSYAAGTRVSMYEDGEWFDGTIVQFGSNAYTIEWDDDEIEEIQAGSIMDKMVQDAGDDDDAPPAGYEGGPAQGASASSPSISVGTAVSIFEEGEWTDGTITDYSKNTYTVQWTDKSIDEYDDSGSDLAELKQAVVDASGDDDAPPAPISGPKFPAGTPVSDFEDGNWVEGTVVNFNDGSYVVRWEDEKELEYYESSNAEDMQELTKMASDANGDDDAPPKAFFDEEDLWQVGTPVAITEEDTLWYGKIDGFSDGEYSIAWENGQTEWLSNFDLVNQMVSNAALSPSRTGMSAAGKAFLSIFIIAACVVGSVFGYKFYEKRQGEQKRERELALEDGGGARSYRDTADDLPKII